MSWIWLLKNEKMKKIVFINEGRLIDDEMSYLMGGATSCPTTYSSGSAYCSPGGYDCFDYGSTTPGPCFAAYSNCSSDGNSYSSCASS